MHLKRITHEIIYASQNFKKRSPNVVAEEFFTTLTSSLVRCADYHFRRESCWMSKLVVMSLNDIYQQVKIFEIPVEAQSPRCASAQWACINALRCCRIPSNIIQSPDEIYGANISSFFRTNAFKSNGKEVEDVLAFATACQYYVPLSLVHSSKSTRALTTKVLEKILTSIFRRHARPVRTNRKLKRRKSRGKQGRTTELKDGLDMTQRRAPPPPARDMFEEADEGFTQKRR